jgi:hypothetical protein
MPDSWSIVSSDDKLTLILVCDRIINEEIHRRERGETTSVALNVERGRRSQRDRNNHGKSKLRKKGRSHVKGESKC